MAKYTPGSIPRDDLSALVRYLTEELQNIAAVISELADGHLDEVHVEPEKPREGDLRIADGTNWNPGSGAGMYRYNGTSWVLLG